MGLGTAFKVFFKALKEPKRAQEFLHPKPEIEADDSHLRLLSLLQRAGRLIDFLKEDISAFEDAQVGAVVRQLHGECSERLEELVTIRPIFDESEGSEVKIPRGYDAGQVKVVGSVKGEPPFTGVLRHRGWRAHKVSLPKVSDELAREVIAPAEVEVSAQ